VWSVSKSPEASDDQPLASFRGKALRGGRWAAIESVGQQLLNIGATAILTRLLAPEDFGVIASATVLVALFESLADVGMTASIIRSDELDETIASTYFWVSIGLGMATMALAIAVSGPLARLFGLPRARDFFVVLSISLFVGYLGAVPRSLLRRALQYGSLAISSLSRGLVYATVAVGLAYQTELGPWAVIIGTVAGATGSVAVATALVGWRPRLAFEWAVVKRDLAFNAGFVGNRFTTYIQKNVDYWIVSQLMGPGALGLYYIAYLFPNIIRQRFSFAAQRTLFPVFSRIRHDEPRLQRAYLDGVRFVTLLTLPAVFGMASASELFIVVGFGSQWVAGADAMAVIAVAAGIDAINTLSGTVFVAQGLMYRLILAGGLRIAVFLGGVSLLMPTDSLVDIAWALLGSVIVFTGLFQWWISRQLRIELRALAGALAPGVVSTFVMVLVLTVFKDFVAGISDMALVQALATVLLGASTYGLAGLLLFPSIFRGVVSDLRTAILPGPGR